MEEDNRARMHSSRIRQMEKRPEKVEEKIPPESLREKDGSKVMETTAQEIPTTKKLKKEAEFFGNARGTMPEEGKNSFKKSLDLNNNTVLKKNATCENELAENGTPNAFETDDFPISQDRQKDERFIDRATSPLKPMQSKFKGKFPLQVIMRTVSGSIPQSSPSQVYLDAALLDLQFSTLHSWGGGGGGRGQLE